MKDNEKLFTIDSDDKSLPEMPEECAESELAIAELRKASLEGKYSFINAVVLGVVMFACAAYFISMTSSKRYGDEGNKFSFERLANGKYTAEISRRYYSTIAYPEELDDLAESITALYGIGGRKDAGDSVPEKDVPAEPITTVTTTASDGQGAHHEEEVTTVSGSDAPIEIETQESRSAETFYETEFVRTTTTSVSLDFDPNNPYPRTTTTEETTTTTNNHPPLVSSTTTEALTSWTPLETTTTSVSETLPPPETSVGPGSSSEQEAPQ